MVRELKYTGLNRKGEWFFGEIRSIVAETGGSAVVNSCGSLGSIFFTDREVVDYETAKTSDTAKYADYFGYMLNSGIYLAPAQFEAMFLSAAHTEEELEHVLELIRTYFKK